MQRSGSSDGMLAGEASAYRVKWVPVHIPFSGLGASATVLHIKCHCPAGKATAERQKSI